MRRALPSDAGAATRLAFAAKAAWGYPAAWLEQWGPELTITAEYLESHDAFVALTDNQPIGICVLDTSTRPASLEHMWVDPACQRRGIGRELVARALARGRELGLSRVEVQSDPHAESFYTRLGARRIGSVDAPMPGDEGRTLPILEFIL